MKRIFQTVLGYLLFPFVFAALLFGCSAQAGSSVSAPPPGWTLIASSGSVSGAANVTFSSIPATYNDLLVVANSITQSVSTNDNIEVRSAGTTFSGNGATMTGGAGTGAFTGAIYIPGVQRNWGTMYGGMTNNLNGIDASTTTCGACITNAKWQATGGITGIKLYPASGTYSTGTFDLYGR